MRLVLDGWDKPFIVFYFSFGVSTEQFRLLGATGAGMVSIVFAVLSKNA